MTQFCQLLAKLMFRVMKRRYKRNHQAMSSDARSDRMDRERN